MSKVLVVGGAGYIGSHCGRLLHKSGYDVTVLDNLSTGYKESVFGKLVVGDIRDRSLLNSLFKRENFDAVFCFAAMLDVAESFRKPFEYFDVNVGGVLSLLSSMRDNGCRKLVFSSTCAIYGMSDKSKVDENQEISPISPYGESKMMVEKILDRVSPEIQSVRFRYFNAAGAAGDGVLGGGHYPKTHLIGSVFDALQKEQPVKIFGQDYPTHDGTGVRDYIHVEDLAVAHLKAIQRLDQGLGGGVWNLGVGKGFSVLEVIREIESVTGKKIQVLLEPRRNGDPAALFADNTKFRTDFGWVPEKSLRTIIEDSWRWEQNPRFGNKPLSEKSASM